MDALPTAVEDALRAMHAHPAVLKARVLSVEKDGRVIVEADFDTNLPSTWRAEGRSPSGVLPRETVQFAFPSSYPARAPYPTLRPDFNTALPHINPHRTGDRIPPCLVYGTLLDVLHADGFARIVDQTAVWLSSAAMGCLIDLERGWEPCRRTSYGGRFEVDVHSLVNQRPDAGGLALFSAFAGWVLNRSYVTALGRGTKVEALPLQAPALHGMWKSVKTDEDIETGRIFVAVCWPKGPSKGQPVIGKFQPDTVGTLGELLVRAEELHCGEALSELLNIGLMMKGQGISRLPPVLVLLPIARPVNLLGLQTNIEMLAYVIDIERNGKTTNIKLDTPVSAISLITPISENLLRHTSGLPVEGAKLQLTLLGCGSFGSKIAMHATRAGYRPDLLVDSAYSSAHHVARHTFLPSDTGKIESKVEGMRRIIDSFSLGRPAIHAGDIMNLPRTLFDEHFKGESRLIVNTTASPAVRDYLTGCKFDARVMEVCGFEQGKCAIATVEGANRSPTTSDLMAYAYEQMRRMQAMPRPMQERERLLSIGVGCNSVTLPMSDARVSLITAGAGQLLLNAMANGLPAAGRASIATVDTDGMSIKWETSELGETLVVLPTHSAPDWTVRLLEPVHSEITRDFESHPHVETGGIIVGRVSTTSREVTITGLLPAPSDSIRRRTLFVLGTKGREESIRAYEESAHGVLWCLGTWHSHLQPAGPSHTDLQTADNLAGISSSVRVLLIRRPDGYSAVVREPSRTTQYRD